MSRPAEKPRGGLWRTEIVRAVLSGHSILGIAFASVIYLVCLTGVLSVFTRDFQRWEQPDAPIVRSASDQATARAIVAMAARAGPTADLFVNLPGSDQSRLIITAHDGPMDDQSWLADGAGQIVTLQRDPWTDFIVDLHTRLHLPASWGRFIVGLAGVALLSSLISGVLAHPRIFRDAFHLRLGGSRRLQEADLHNRLGVWALPFHVVVALTGALLGLSTIIVGVLALLLFRGDTTRVYNLLAPKPPAADVRAAPMPDVVALLGQARRIAPEALPHLITIDHWGRRDMRLTISATRPRLIAAQDSFTFDARGRLVAHKHPQEQNLGERILGSLGPLHFGWYGGGTILLAYGLLGVALCMVTSSGITVWLSRRRDKGRPAPGWERIWTAVAWGQPALLVLTGWLGLFRLEAALLPLWAGGTLLMILAAAIARGIPWQTMSRGLRAITGILLAALAATHAWINAGSPSDAVPIVMDLSFLIGGLGLVVLAMTGSRQWHRLEKRPLA